MKWLHSKKLSVWFLQIVGLILVVYFAVNTYPVGHWFGEFFGISPVLSGFVFASVIGGFVFLMLFQKEHMKKAAHNHTNDTGDSSFRSAFGWFTIFVLGLELASVGFRWIELARDGNFAMGWVILALGCLAIGLSIVIGKILHAMMNPTPARAAANLREEAGTMAYMGGAEQLPHLTNAQQRALASGDPYALDDVRDERAMAREREVQAVEERRRREEEARRINEEMYQKMTTPRYKPSSNGHSKQPTSF